MPANTPKYAFPYPLGTDLIADGDDSIKALAERVEAVLGDGAGAWVPYVPAVTGVPANVGLARYWLLGKTAVVVCKLAITGASTAGIVVATPKPVAAGITAQIYTMPVGLAIAATPAASIGPVWVTNANGFSFGTTTWGPGQPGAWANGHTLGFFAVFETT